MSKVLRLVAVAAVAVSLSGCAESRSRPRMAESRGRPHIADLRADPGRYHHRTVSVDGVITSSWGLPFLPFLLFKVDDGTGEMTVLSQGSPIPPRGTHVRVRGLLDDLGMLGGQTLGLHLREEGLYVRR